MLKKANRLPASRFREKFPLHKRTRLFSAKIKSTNLSLSRFGVVIAKTIDKRATRRNQLRRAIYRSLQEGRFELVPGKDVIIFVQPAALSAHKADIAFAINELLT